MILLDTNVISEPLKTKSDPNVLAWLDLQAIETLYLSTITLAELRFGIAILPEGKKKRDLFSRLDETIILLFKDRILSFDEKASAMYGILRAQAKDAGHSIASADGYIAAIAHTHHFMIATRDTMPFEAVGLTVINPWKLL